MVRVKIFGENGERNIEGNNSGEIILKKLGLNASSTIILRNGRPIPEDTIVEENDEITVIKSFSGG